MDDELNWIIEKLHYVDILAVSYFRECTVRLLAEAGVSIELYGTGWEECDFITSSDVHFGGRISADDVVKKMHDAKIVLSTMTWFKDGTHDRVFNGMLSGAVALTDTSIYMKENFNGVRDNLGKLEGVAAGKGILSDSSELVMFELERKQDNYRYPTLEEVPELVKRLLSDAEMMQKIADTGRERALRLETWAKRAGEMDRDLLEQL